MNTIKFQTYFLLLSLCVHFQSESGTNLSSEDALIKFTQPKSYGSFISRSKENITNERQQLTYTWHNIDVFGETTSKATMSSSLGEDPFESIPSPTLAQRIKSRLRGDAHVPRPRKHLLKNVSGIAYPGELLAVMGSSGAGKTTLLNVLSFRSPNGVQVSNSAVRALNGVTVSAKQLRSQCAYIQQDDLFIGSLTAREHLIFQAMLRLERQIPYKEKVRRVDEVIVELSLTKCQNTVIGLPGRVKGLSGGERKRLSFASEALTDPMLLLCDEPTSGLDSFMAHNVLQVLKRLAEKGKTIVLTIHQPSSEIFSMFDKLLLIAEGRVSFLGTAADANSFFAHLDAPCPTNYNPADFYVELLAIVPGKEEDSRIKVRQICDAFTVSEYNSKISNEIAELQLKGQNRRPSQFNGSASIGYRASWLMQFRAILWRSWSTVLKEPLLVRVRLIQTIVRYFILTISFSRLINKLILNC